MKKLILAILLLVAGVQAQTNVRGNNGTFTGTLTAGVVGKVYMADQCAGADASIKINACIAKAIADGGGTVDARSLVGSQTISQEIDVGSHAQLGVVLLLPQFGNWFVTITDGTSCAIKQFGNSSVIGTGSGGANHMFIRSNSALTNVSSFWCTEASPTSGGQYVRAEGFSILNDQGAAAASGAFLAQYLFDDSYIANILVSDATNDGVVSYGNCCGTTFLNVTANESSTGKRGIYFKADATKVNTAVSCINCSADHPGNGFAAVDISGGAAAPTEVTNKDINFYNLWTEEDQNTNPTTMLKISDARGVHVFGWHVNTTGIATTNAGFVGLDISQTAANQVRDVQISGYAYVAPGTGNGIVNHITGETLLPSTRYQPRYLYGGSAGSQTAQPDITADLEAQRKDASGNVIQDLPVDSTTDFLTKWIGWKQYASPSSTSYTRLFTQDDGASGTIFNVEPTPQSGTAAAEARFFRSVNTSGSRLIRVFKGDGSGTATATIDAATGIGTFTGGMKVTNLLASGTAPSIAAAGCGGAAASISTNNGTASFDINVGTTPTSGGCTVTMPAAVTRWNCSVNDYTTISTSVFMQKQTASTTTSVTFQNYSDVAVATAPTASDVYHVQCSAE